MKQLLTLPLNQTQNIHLTLFFLLGWRCRLIGWVSPLRKHSHRQIWKFVSYGIPNLHNLTAKMNCHSDPTRHHSPSQCFISQLIKTELTSSQQEPTFNWMREQYSSYSVELLL